MIYRLSTKLSKKIKEDPKRCYPQHTNPHLDWSAHIFTAARFQYILISNTHTLYSIVMPAKGIVDARNFIVELNRKIAEYMHTDGFGMIYERIIEPKSMTVLFSKALNRSVTGYLNEFVFNAKCYLIENNLSPFEVSSRLNQFPLLKRNFFCPREGFHGLEI